jgi:hypothetical protein
LQVEVALLHLCNRLVDLFTCHFLLNLADLKPKELDLISQLCGVHGSGFERKCTFDHLKVVDGLLEEAISHCANGSEDRAEI